MFKGRVWAEMPRYIFGENKMKLKTLLGIIFTLLSLACMAICPIYAPVGFHIKVDYSFTCLFVGLYFLTK